MKQNPYRYNTKTNEIQRIAVNTLRGKLMDEQKARHKAELALKDAEAKLAEANHYRCEANGWCDGRIPPRPRTKVKPE